MAAAEVVIVGKIVLDAPADLDGAVAEVRLYDAPLADAPSRTVAEARRGCSGRDVREIPFRLTAMAEAGKEYGLAAEVRRRGGDRLEPGDLLSTRRHSWRRGAEEEVEVAVEPIR
jgi:uncharacterized lipoprotein YbaY